MTVQKTTDNNTSPSTNSPSGTKKAAAVKSGLVVSNKMDKTVVVEVVSLKTHKKYRKKYRETTRFKIHDDKNQVKVGDKITFRSCRPLSRHKKWELVEIVS